MGATDLYCVGEAASATHTCLQEDHGTWKLTETSSSSLEGAHSSSIPLRLVSGRIGKDGKLDRFPHVVFEGENEGRSLRYELVCADGKLTQKVSEEGKPTAQTPVFSGGPYPNQLPVDTINEWWWPAQEQMWAETCGTPVVPRWKTLYACEGDKFRLLENEASPGQLEIRVRVDSDAEQEDYIIDEGARWDEVTDHGRRYVVIDGLLPKARVINPPVDPNDPSRSYRRFKPYLLGPSGERREISFFYHGGLKHLDESWRKKTFSDCR